AETHLEMPSVQRGRFRSGTARKIMKAKAMRTRYNDVTPYITKDGSVIRELMHPALHGNRNQSFAEAIVAPGTETHLHRHRQTEEIYYIVQGAGIMRLGEETFEVSAGDSIAIA